MCDREEKDCPEKELYGGGKCDAEDWCDNCQYYIGNDKGFCNGCQINLMEKCKNVQVVAALSVITAPTTP